MEPGELDVRRVWARFFASGFFRFRGKQERCFRREYRQRNNGDSGRDYGKRNIERGAGIDGIDGHYSRS